MPDRWQDTADGYSLRFFSPEQVDQILRDGLGRGREGTHAAIERILKHEPALQRADMWRRLRRLKNPARRSVHFRSVWTSEDERILREGYQNGWRGKREAVRELLRRHPAWHPHLIWRQAAKLGLVRRPTKRCPERSRRAWSEEDDRMLLDLAGYKKVRVISKLVRRSEAAVRARLTVLGKSSRAHLEGFARFALARDLHLSANTIQRFVVEGLLEVRDPRITRESLDGLRRRGGFETVAVESASATEQGADHESAVSRAPLPAARNLPVCSVSSGKVSRAKRVWREVAESLNVTQEAVESLILRGVLKLYDPRITEKSLRNFCRRHGSLISSDFLTRETCEWLKSTMDFVPHAGEPIALCLTPLRKHARVVRQCEDCGRSIRGNAFFRHRKRCSSAKRELD